MMKDAVNVFTKTSISRIVGSQIWQALDPEGWWQRFLYRLAKQAGLIRAYIPMIEKASTSVVRLDGETKDNITKAILGFMRDGLSSPTELVILMGNKEAAEIQASMMAGSTTMIMNQSFARIDGLRFYDVEIKVVPYLIGALVVRKRDLK